MKHKRGKAGPPSKKTDAVVEAVLDAAEKGGSKRSSAAAAGISPATLRNWMRDDPDLADAFEIAQGKFEQKQLQNIQGAAQESRHWTASAWLLERIFPERYAQQSRGSVQNESGGHIPIAIAVQIQKVLVDGGALQLEDTRANDGDVVEAEWHEEDALGSLRALATTTDGEE